MNMTRWMLFAALAALSSTWVRADPVPPDGHYLIDLEGWDADEDFNFSPNPTSIPTDVSPCLPVGDICGDASIRIDSGGGSTGESGDFEFTSGDGTETLYFDNEGQPITSIMISTTLFADENNDFFSCDGGNLFQSCGFVLTDPPTGDTLDIYFYNPYTSNGIPSVTPEPSQWIILLLAFAGIIVARVRKGSASLSSAQTQRSVCPTRGS